MVIQVDTREKERAIKKILFYFDAHGVEHFSHSLPTGDYMSIDNAMLLIDRKQNLSELVTDFSKIQRVDKKTGKPKWRCDHKPDCNFYTEVDKMERAKRRGQHLVFLCEHGGSIRTLDDVIGWKNPRLKESPLALSGERLYKIMVALQSTYGVEWQFCDKNHTGQRIIELLGGNANG